MRIFIATHSLTLGGLERVVVDLSKAWSAAGHSVTVATLLDRATDFYGLDERVRRVDLVRAGRPERTPGFGLVTLKIRRALSAQRPDLAIGMGSSYSTMVALAAAGLTGKTVGCEFSSPADAPSGLPRRLLRRMLYPRLDAVVSGTEAAGAWFAAHIPVRHVQVVPQYLSWPLLSHEPIIEPQAVCRPGRRIVLAAGRLEPVKGFDILLQAFARIAARFADCDLVILGDGRMRAALEGLTESLALGGRVLLPGQAGNLSAWLARAELFAVSSRHEGGPNVLVEALAHGVPAVSFDCDCGPREIIRDGVDGMLVAPANAAALGDGIARLLSDRELAASMARQAAAARQRFCEAAHLAAWDTLFADLGCPA